MGCNKQRRMESLRLGVKASFSSYNFSVVERRHSERTCLALLPCHFQVQILGTKNGSCAAGTPPASQGGWIFGISVFHHCGWHHEGQVRDRASLYWCFSNPNCDFFCSGRRTPPSPPSTPSWTSSCGTLAYTSSGSPGFPGSR